MNTRLNNIKMYLYNIIRYIIFNSYILIYNIILNEKIRNIAYQASSILEIHMLRKWSDKQHFRIYMAVHTYFKNIWRRKSY